MQPLQCDLRRQVANPHVYLISTHMATEHGNIHAAVALRSATADSNTLYEPIARQNERPAPAAQMRHPPSPAPATLYTQKNAMFRAPASFPTRVPCNIRTAITMSQSHDFPQSPHLPKIRHHFPKSPLPKVTTSESHHFSKTPLP